MKIIAGLMCFSTFCLALPVSHSQTTSSADALRELKPGVVIEKFEDEFSGAKKAGLEEGDVLLHWSRGESKGDFDSPFDLFQVTIEEFSRGAVTLEGLRGEKKQIWTETKAYWGAKVRPNFSGSFLASYRDGKRLAEAGDLIQAAERWRAAAAEAQSQSSWLGLWFLFEAAQLLANGQQWKQTDEIYKQADLLSAELGPAIHAQLLRDWALTFYQRSDWAQAEKYFQQAVVESRRAGTEITTSYCLNTLGFVARGRGDLPKAEEYLMQELQIQERLEPGRLDVANTLTSIGAMAWARGDLRRSEEYFRKGWAIFEKQGPGTIGAAYVLNNLGAVARLRGDLERAAEYYRKALTIEEKVDPGSLDMAAVLISLAKTLDLRGESKQAEELLAQALKIKEKLAPGSEEDADIRQSLGELAQNRHDSRTAEQFYQQALEIREKLATASLPIAEALNSLAEVVLERGDLAKAEDYYRRALALRESLAPGSMYHAESLAAMAGIMRRKGQLDAAAELYSQALNALEGQMARFGGSNEDRAGFRAKHASTYLEYIDLLVKRKQPEQAFNILERSKARILLETLALAHVDIRKGVNAALMDRERSLRADIGAKADRRIHLLSDKQGENQVAAVNEELNRLLLQYRDVQEEIHAASPAYAALTQPRPMNARDVEQSLDRETLLLEYSLGEERSYLFAVTSASIGVYELPRRAEIEGMARQIYQVWTAQNRIFPQESTLQRQGRLRKENENSASMLAQLSRVILGPVAEQLKGKRLLIVSDGALQYIPFAALPSPDLVHAGLAQEHVPLVIEHEIINLPSASLVATVRREAAPRKAVAVLADPVFAKDDIRVAAGVISRKPAQAILVSKRSANDEDLNEETTVADSVSQLTRSAADLGMVREGQPYLPRLPFSRREAQAILSVSPKGQAMEALDFRASRATAVSSELSQYRVLHFATHGLLNSEHPELSGLVFSLVDPQGRPQDGFLGLEDIYNLNLHADLVVLSACETALGKDVQGEGLIGLTRGFMYAGASQVMASLWSVDDAATAALMRFFYKAMERDGLRPAAALRRAQMEIRKQERRSEPYYWAGFVIQGERR